MNGFALSRSFTNFFNSGKSAGVLLIVCTIASVVAANSSVGGAYASFWERELAGLTVKHWVNDGLMAVFFLLIGLELERELYNGELSDVRNALLPIAAALGGICVPAAIYYALNFGSPMASGIGIPMATDIAFALGALALLGPRIPAALKVFLAALAVMDDLAAIVVIAIFYSAKVSFMYLGAALVVLSVLILMNRPLRVMSFVPYLLGGAVLWVLMLKSGVHATIAGVVLAFAIPFSARSDDERSPSHRLEHILHKPVAFLILPIFALANTAIQLDAGWYGELLTASTLGIIGGLVVGKPIGIALASYLAVSSGFCRLPEGVRWPAIFGAGLLGGIGFTMSIFIANLAFPGRPDVINASTVAIVIASLIAGVSGLTWLRFMSSVVSSSRS